MGWGGVGEGLISRYLCCRIVARHNHSVELIAEHVDPPSVTRYYLPDVFDRHIDR